MMNFALYGKKRIPTPTPNQLFLLKQREKQLNMYLLSKNNISEHVKRESEIESENKIVEYESKDEKEVIVYEVGLDVDSLEIPEPKLEEPMIQELSEPSAEPST